MLNVPTAIRSAWDYLEAGVSDRHHPMHLAAVATARGGLPEARYVVVRHADRVDRAVHFHTDIRAPKTDDVGATPEIAILCYHRDDKVQLRMRATATRHHQDEIAKAAWEKTRLFSRECYLTPSAPSSAAGDAEPQQTPGAMQLTQEQSELGYANFCVVRCVVREIDYLHLRHEGHQRLRLCWDGDWAGEWLHP